MKAFENRNGDYYRLKKNCLGLKPGAIFYHDKEDDKLGSIGAGCLKLCYDISGGCKYGPCGDTYILHASAAKDRDFLEKIDIKKEKDCLGVLHDFLSVEISTCKKSTCSSAYSDGKYSLANQMLKLIEKMQS